MFKSKRKRKAFVGRRQQYRRVQEAVNKAFAADNNRIPCYTIAYSTSNRTDYLLLNKNKLDISDTVTNNINNNVTNNDTSNLRKKILTMLLLL